MDELLLTIGNKNYSSWSLRPWILMKHLGLAFEERLMPLDTPEYACELAGRGWPADRAARAENRHTAPNSERAADIARVEELWADCRARFGAGGPWLFGEYCVADAMYAPVVLRFRTYAPRLRETSSGYVATVLADAHIRDWLQSAAAESWVIESSEIGR